jgi:hypothetical protein|tara:strand:- start:690 stop:914 length:225 start_codon:yes stop_codon:yes gene_type:complete
MEEKDFYYFEFLGERCIKHLFKDFLYQLEDIQEKYSIEDDDFERIRNRVLDKGNDTIRFFRDQGENYTKLNSGE